MKLENAFTIDVEDYYQVEAFSNTIDRADWDVFESRVADNTEKILTLLEACNISATFFVLGCVARKQPEIVKSIAAQGHEIASHGMSHKLIYNQEPNEFRQETRNAKALLEDICQQEVIGYRAATYSITKKSLWALDIIAEAGFSYDSSIFPVTHDKYGIPDAETEPHELETPNGRKLIEFPISTVKTKLFNIPIAGGGYFRLLPYELTRLGLQHINNGNREFMFYLHPWEIDPEQPEITNAGFMTKFRHYVNISKCSDRLKRLLEDFNFTTMREVLEKKGLLVNGKIDKLH